MTIFVVPAGRDAWDFYGAASVDGAAQQVRGRAGRDVVVVVERAPGGGLRYRGIEIRPISGGSDAPDGGGSVLGEEGPPKPP